jgi:hypothetical protein
LYSSPILLGFIKSKIMRREGDAMCMGEEQSHESLVGKHGKEIFMRQT